MLFLRSRLIMRIQDIALSLLLALVLTGSLYAKEMGSVTAIPQLVMPVMDTANMMSPATRESLSQSLQAYSQKQGSQIAVLTVPTLTDETPFEYGARVMEVWQLGRKGIDDGVLLLIVRDDRTMQLLVGRGLEGAIPDAYARRILDGTLTPALQAGDADAGIVNAVTQIQSRIAGEALPEATSETAQDEDIRVLGIIVVMYMFAQGIRLFLGKTIAGLAAGALGFVISWFMGLGVLMSLLVFASVFLGAMGRLGKMGSGRGGFGGGSGKGGFRGGGGGFGGGGASGRW